MEKQSYAPLVCLTMVKEKELPYKEDRRLTKRIEKCGELLGIEMYDHVIIGNGYFSFQESEVWHE